MKKFLNSSRGSALLLALSLVILMVVFGQTQKLVDAPLKAKATWHATVHVASPEPGE